MPKPVSLSTVLGNLKNKLAPSVTAGLVMSIWRMAVGEKIALHCKPVNWQGGELKIICDSSVWASALMSNETSAIKKIQSLTKSNLITSLHVQVRVSQKIKNIPNKRRIVHEVSPAMIAESEELSEHLPDNLRASFQKAYISQKRYRRS